MTSARAVVVVGVALPRGPPAVAVAVRNDAGLPRDAADAAEGVRPPSLR